MRRSCGRRRRIGNWRSVKPPRWRPSRCGKRSRTGVELLSPDRRLRIVNTVASRLQRGRDEFLKMISDAFQERVKT